MRLAWQQARPTPLLTNPPLFDLRGGHLLTPDLLDPVRGVAGEYDGAVHLRDDRRRVDVDRARWLRRGAACPSHPASASHFGGKRALPR